MNFKIIELDNVDSTNSYLKNHINEFDNFTFAFASHQNLGHGRFDRVWESNANENILCSILIKDKELLKNWKHFSSLSAYCVYSILTHNNIFNVSIKWPNDIYVNDKKICGILLESRLPEYVVIGIGLNVNQSKFKNENATSVFLETKIKSELQKYKDQICRQFVTDFNNLKKDDSFYLSTYQNNNYLVNKKITFEDLTHVFEGTVIGIDAENHLKVSTENQILVLSSGEVNIKK